MTLSDILAVAIGLIILCLLPAMCRTLRQRVDPAFAALAAFMHGAWHRAEWVVTKDGQLSLSDTIEQMVGGLVMIVAFFIFGAADLQLTLATLAPMLQVETSTSLLGAFEQLLGLSIVLLALVYGIALSDLARWTFVSRFAVIRTGRIAAFCIALFCFLASLIVAVALAAYRLPALIFDGSAMSPVEVALWLQSLPIIILLSLAVLLFIGVFFAFMNIGAFGSAVFALFLAISWVITGLVYLALQLVDVALDIVLACTETVSASTAPLGSSFGDGVRGLMSWIRRGWHYVMDKIASLVGIERPIAPN